jgi:hypothetical protein
MMPQTKDGGTTMSMRNGSGDFAGRAVPSRPVVPPEEQKLSPLSDEDRAALSSFDRRQGLLRDWTRGCVEGHHTGMHIYGPPGVSKSHTILGTLREMRADYRVHQRITAKPLYLELERHPGAIHVVEDCEQLFTEKSAQTLLRSALGGESVKGQRERRVSYSVSGAHARVMWHYFFGALIFTSNRALSDERPEIGAVLSRIPHIAFSPPDNEVRALMRSVARLGHTQNAHTISPSECVEIVEFVIQLAAELKCRLDLRWINHGYGHYLTHLASGGETDWRDSVRFHCMEALTRFDHTPSSVSDRGNDGARLSAEQQIAIVREIELMPGLTQDERVLRWENRTKLSRATYYRRREATGGILPRN